MKYIYAIDRGRLVFFEVPEMTTANVTIDMETIEYLSQKMKEQRILDEEKED